MARTTGWLHHALRQRVLLGEGIVDQQIRCVDFSSLIGASGGRGLDALAEQVLEVAFFWS